MDRWMYRKMDVWTDECMDVWTDRCFYPLVKQIISVCRLENNRFKDNVMELLGSLLSAKDCQVQKIRSGSGVGHQSERPNEKVHQTTFMGVLQCSYAAEM